MSANTLISTFKIQLDSDQAELFETLGFEVPEPLTADNLKELVERASAYAIDNYHPIFSPLIQTRLDEVLAMAQLRH